MPDVVNEVKPMHAAAWMQEHLERALRKPGSARDGWLYVRVGYEEAEALLVYLREHALQDSRKVFGVREATLPESSG